MRKIKVLKARSTIDFDFDDCPPHIQEEVIHLGAMMLLNRYMSKLSIFNIPDDTERHKRVMEQAEANLVDAYAGRLRTSVRR